MASNIRVNSNPTGNIHINANDERPRYAGYTITAERSQTEHGTLITAEDWRGITESMVYDGVGIETLVYNDDFTVTITLMDGRTFTTEDTVARGVDQAESAAEHALESQRAASASEGAAAGSATQASAAAGSALAYANRAETAATAASTYANRARASAESIDGILEVVTALEASTTQKANEARDYATQASGAASTATAKAAEAGQSASSASADASRAESYKTDALNAKTAAEEAADNAEASETSANASAVEASTYASNASASATASATSASEAEASAQSAAQSAATVYSLLPADTASGDIASFPDGANAVPMDYLKVMLEPIQDLNGYDKPWAGGAGANLLDSDYAIKFTLSKTITFPQTILSGTKVYTHNDEFSYTTPPSSGDKYPFYVFRGANNENRGQVWGLSDGSVTLSGDAVAIELWSNGYDYGASIGVEVTISGLTISKTEQTTYSPYSNICPISGWESVEVFDTGVNVWDEEWENGGIRSSNGANSTDANRIRAKNLIPIVETTYYVKAPSNLTAFYYDANKDFMRSLPIGSNSTFTPTSGARYMRFTVGSSSSPVTTYNNDISINYPSTDHDYHAYTATTHTTDLGRTVYGGTVDVVSGQLVDNMAIVDLGTLNWINHSSGVFWAIVNGKKKGVSNIVCSQYETSQMAGVGNLQNNQIVGENGGLAVYIKDTRFTTDAAAFKTAMDGVQLCYELATPQTIQLTPTEVRTLLGQNNVWSDGVYHPLVKRYLKDNSWVGRYINGVMYYVNNGYGYLHTDTFKDASVSCSHFAVKKFVSKPTDTSTPLADNALYLTDDGSLYVRYDAIEDEDPTVSPQNWIDFVTDNNVYLTVPSYSDTASDSLEVELEYRADVALWVERKLHE